MLKLVFMFSVISLELNIMELLNSFLSITHNYIINYLIFYIESSFCDRINGTYFYRDEIREVVFLFNKKETKES